MDRHCKNCNSLIYAGKSYCADCGAKWIDNRITIKQVAADFGDLYIGIDTKFVRTFVDLFKIPEAVITGYITGRRAKYMDAIRYLLLALFVAGIYTLVLKKTDAFAQFVPDAGLYKSLNYSEAQLEETNKMNSIIQESVMDYQGLIYFFTIPLLALVARITFWGKRFMNFAEQNVFYMYTYSHMTIVTTIFSIAIALIRPSWLSTWGISCFLFMLIYNAYCYKRIFSLSIKDTILKTLLAVTLLVILMIITVIIFVIIAVLIAIAGKKMGFI